MGCGSSSKAKGVVENPSSKAKGVVENPIAFPAIGDRKLNVLVLHGTSMDGPEMQGMYKWKECGIETFCNDIANFYYPTGPCIVAKNHAFYTAVPDRKTRGDKGRHWWKMTDKWKFSDDNFDNARQTIVKFLNEEVKQTIDVIAGYSQGAAATTQVLNDLHKGKMASEHLKSVRGAIFHGCPQHPHPVPAVCTSVKSLHCNGTTDPLTSLEGAKKHAAAFKDGTFFEFEGGHEVRKIQQEPVRQFLLQLKTGGKDSE
eukprot:TRINITY_DN12755_c0_g2_i1.p1 TRINITY_DN12755_c0_g2~~TRINITY_DN12755_c0_g2_i1.p1  ORF type:complete len:257 (-),score=40.01 TRINITY_DN12755_c0_g2_i1:186-956(-)